MSAHNFIDLTGREFKYLTVIKRVKNNKHNQAQWLCKCKCGNEVIVTGHNLIKNNTKSCGCLQKEIISLSYGEAAFRALYRNYKNNAIKRGFEWNLTIEQFKVLTKGNCIYCNIKPKQINKVKNYNGNYIYNGIDRVNNDLGYTMENCVSCCSKCNYAKNNMTLKEFKEWIKRISNNL